MGLTSRVLSFGLSAACSALSGVHVNGCTILAAYAKVPRLQLVLRMCLHRRHKYANIYLHMIIRSDAAAGCHVENSPLDLAIWGYILGAACLD